MPFFELVEKQCSSTCTYAVPLGDRVRRQLELVHQPHA